MSHVMGPYEGAALRVQLDGMLATLLPFASLAGEAADQPVIALLAGLQSARAAADVIERRSTSTTGRGVSLAKR